MQNSLLSIPIPYRQENISLKERFAIFRKELLLPILVMFAICGLFSVGMIMNFQDENKIISVAFVCLIVFVLASLLYGATLCADLFDGKKIVCLLDFEKLVKIGDKYETTFKVHQEFTLKIDQQFFENFRRGDVFELYFLPLSQTILSVRKISPSEKIAFTMSHIKAPGKGRYLLSVLLKTQFLALMSYLSLNALLLLWFWLISLEDYLYEDLLGYWQTEGLTHLAYLSGLSALFATAASLVTYSDANRKSWQTAFTCVAILAVVVAVTYHLLYGDLS